MNRLNQGTGMRPSTRYALMFVAAVILVAVGFVLGSTRGGGNPAIAAASSGSGGLTPAAAAGRITTEMEGTYLLSPSEREAVFRPLVAPSILDAVIKEYDQNAPALTQKFGLPTNVDASKQAYIKVVIMGTRTMSESPSSAIVRVWSTTYTGTNNCSAAVEVWSVNEDRLQKVNGTWRLAAAKPLNTQIATSNTACMATSRTQFEGT